MKNITKTIYILTIIASGLIYVLTLTIIKSEELKYIRLSQIYSLTGLSLLYITLLISPLFAAIPNFPFKPYIIKARKGLGVSAFFFALLHGITSFFKLLGGFQGIPFLNQDYIQAILLSTTALIILAIMAITSIHFFIEKLGKWWKRLHRLVYLAGILILIHALMLGTHFANLSTTIPQITLVALIVLILLEFIRIDRYLTSKYSQLPPFVSTITLSTLASLLVIIYGTPYLDGTKTANIHTRHESQNFLVPKPQPNMDHTSQDMFYPSRFIVKENNTDTVPINKEFTKEFSIFDQKSQQNVSLFRTIFEKQMHTIITDSTLTFFQHTHPTQNQDKFLLTTTVPSHGIYYVYLDYEPIGATEQQSLFKLYTTSENSVFPLSSQPVDRNTTKTFGNYEVTLNNADKLTAINLKSGVNTLSFTIKDNQTKQPITNLQPYLGAFGHLSMINQTDYSFTHVHPKAVAVSPTQLGGPTVEFAPMPLSNTLISGNYRVFAEFKHNDQVFATNFTIKVQ
jgi:DMSO/TMAO reductase YedYZ heme-binding membrane subunit